LPGISSSSIIPEVAPEQNPAPTQEAKHEVNICT
jgi:hypothetical protein